MNRIEANGLDEVFEDQAARSRVCGSVADVELHPEVTAMLRDLVLSLNGVDSDEAALLLRIRRRLIEVQQSEGAAAALAAARRVTAIILGR